MRFTPAFILLLFFAMGFAASPAEAQGRGRFGGPGAQGIPPGQLPPAGTCRVWFEGRPPGQQPRPMNCRAAEIIASRNRSARVIYGPATGARGGLFGPNDPRSRGRAVPRAGGPAYPSNLTAAFDNGYRDGYEQGWDDADDDDAYNPVRHSRYRSADRGYNQRGGSRADYSRVYRDGFRLGYDEGYRDVRRYGSDRTRNRSDWWPF
jgi:hypothetical protein